MKFPVRFVTISICLTFVACALIKEATELEGKLMDLRVLNAIQEIQSGLNKPNKFKLWVHQPQVKAIRRDLLTATSTEETLTALTGIEMSPKERALWSRYAKVALRQIELAMSADYAADRVNRKRYFHPKPTDNVRGITC